MNPVAINLRTIGADLFKRVTAGEFGRAGMPLRTRMNVYAMQLYRDADRIENEQEAARRQAQREAEARIARKRRGVLGFPWLKWAA